MVFIKARVELQGNKLTMENADIEEALDIVGVGRYNYILLFTCCFIYLGSVVDMLGYSLVVPAATCDLQLTLAQSGVLTSVPFAGFMFALPWGYFADTRGRRKALLLSCAGGFILSGLSSFSTSFYAMLVMKFLGCSFSAASQTLAMTYLGECTPKNYRSKYLFILNCYCLAADATCFVLAYMVLTIDMNIPVPLLTTYKPWRLLILTMVIPLGAGVVLLCFLKESPKFLLDVGQTDKALEVLKYAHSSNVGSENNFPILSLNKTIQPDESVSFWRSVVRQTVPIFRPPLLWRTAQLFFILSICGSTNNVFFMWFPAMVNSFFSGESEQLSFCHKIVANITPAVYDSESCTDETSLNTIYSGIIFTLSCTLFNVAVIGLAAWRRSLLLAIFLITGACCILVDHVDDPIGSIALFSLIQLTGLCIGTVGSYFVDIYPTSYRGLATSLGMMVARFTCLAGVNLVGANMLEHCRLTFYCWSIFIFGGVVAVLYLPSDKKISQTETDSNGTRL